MEDSKVESSFQGSWCKDKGNILYLQILSGLFGEVTWLHGYTVTFTQI